MSHVIPTTLSQFLFNAEAKNPALKGISGMMEDVAVACKHIAHACSRGNLTGVSGLAGAENIQGEEQKKIDVLANDLFISANRWGERVCALVSEEEEHPWIPPAGAKRGEFILLFDPLDGSSNSDINVSVGSIFSVLRAPADYEKKPFDANWALRPGREQVAAGYVLYGQATIMVLTLGEGVHAFTLDREVGEFIHSHENIRLPNEAKEFAINTSNARFWEPPVKHYIEECLLGKEGARGKDFNMRWVASLVVEVHRILMRGGVFLYPRDNKVPKKEGRLRLMYECNPIAFLIEQAGGLATTGHMPIMDVVPNDFHQRISFIFGAADEVRYIEKLHQELPTHDHDSPLFKSRGLFGK